MAKIAKVKLDIPRPWAIELNAFLAALDMEQDLPAAVANIKQVLVTQLYGKEERGPQK